MRKTQFSSAIICTALGAACLAYYWYGTAAADSLVNMASAFGAPAIVSESFFSRLTFSAAIGFLVVGTLLLILSLRNSGMTEVRTGDEAGLKRVFPWVLLFIVAGAAGYLLSHYVTMKLCEDAGGRWDRQQQNCTYLPKK